MAARLLISLVAALALVGVGYWWGHAAADNAWQAKHARELEAERAQTDQETKRADQAAASYLQEHLDHESRYAALDATYQNLRRRVPLVVPGAAVVAARCDPPGPYSPGPDERRASETATAGDGGPVLTLAAVRMWNGALTGTDQAAGACGPAGAAEDADAACAQGSGLAIEDVWTNHALNARSCAEDRQRYRALIDLLNHTKGE